MGFVIRDVEKGDLPGLLKLYTYLGNNPMPVIDSRVEAVFLEILSQKNQHILIGEAGGIPVSSITITVLQSLANGQLPYAVAEHMVTHESFRGHGFAGAMLAKAEEIARGKDCYKIMLMTENCGDAVYSLYKRAGFSSEGKTAYSKTLYN